MAAQSGRIAGFGRLEDGLRQAGALVPRGAYLGPAGALSHWCDSTALANWLKLACLAVSGWPELL